MFKATAELFTTTGGNTSGPFILIDYSMGTGSIGCSDYGTKVLRILDLVQDDYKGRFTFFPGIIDYIQERLVPFLPHRL